MVPVLNLMMKRVQATHTGRQGERTSDMRKHSKAPRIAIKRTVCQGVRSVWLIEHRLPAPWAWTIGSLPFRLLGTTDRDPLDPLDPGIHRSSSHYVLLMPVLPHSLRTPSMQTTASLLPMPQTKPLSTEAPSPSISESMQAPDSSVRALLSALPELTV